MKTCKTKMRNFALGGRLGDNEDRTEISQIANLGSQIAMGDAMSSLSNTERSQLANPTNAAYNPAKIGGIAPGSSAAASIANQQNSIKESLRNNLISQLPDSAFLPRAQQRPATGGPVQSSVAATSIDSPWIGGGTGDPSQATWNTAKQNGTWAFADGGKIDPEELMRRMSSKYGAPKEAAQAAPTPAPVQRIDQLPAPQPSSITGGLLGQATSALAQRNAELAKYANGGKISGPGTPTSDSIDAEVVETKEPIRIANGERIVSKAQDTYLEGIAKGMGFHGLDAMLEAGTGKPVGPTIKAGKRAAASGLPPIRQNEEANPTPMQQFNTTPVSISFEPSQKAAENVAAIKAEFQRQNGRPLGGQVQAQAPEVTGQKPVAAPAPVSATPTASPVMNNAKAAASIASGIPTSQFTKTADLNIPQGEGVAARGTSTTDATKMTAPDGGGFYTKPNGTAVSIAGGQTYTGADGKPTSHWTDTARYKEQMAVNDRMRNLATQMERDRYGRDMGSDITNPQVKFDAAQNLERMNKAQILDQSGQTAAIDRQAKQLSIDSGMYDLGQKKTLATLQNDLLYGDTEEKRTAAKNNLSMLNGGSRQQQMLVVPGGKTKDTQGNEETAPSMVFDPNTRSYIPMRQTAQSNVPDFNAFAKHVRDNNKGKAVSDAELKSAYDKQFGGK